MRVYSAARTEEVLCRSSVEAVNCQAVGTLQNSEATGAAMTTTAPRILQ